MDNSTSGANMLSRMLEKFLSRLTDRNQEPRQSIEPGVIAHLCFTGNSAELAPFLYAINDCLPLVSSSFASEKCKINCVARHFCYGSSRAATTATQPISYDWWSSILQENTACQHLPLESNPLPSNPYVLPNLISLLLFSTALPITLVIHLPKIMLGKPFIPANKGP
ncbi:hypothetical protein O181_101523 [Austropuccinia psidii MF-1]|uniref:Uncharacterized protein n=1 Tax=Austropuccinia psidii MF-1 TaxID=1389203 RepID=A0A9Q3JGQ1_9BASI|nr:hypothetical protein [Austropuccinia psidii MF-1]